MDKVFISVLNMSLTGSYVILCVILARQLLKRAPKAISYGLWSVVGFRLLIPFSFESALSLLPGNTNPAPIPHDIIYQQSPHINSGVEVVDRFINQSLPVPLAGASANPLQTYINVASYIWILGIILLLIYSVLSVFKLKIQLRDSQEIEENIFQAKNLKTPFVFGIIKPKIYLPRGLDSEEKRYILLHEQIHIRRKDHLVKILAFLILTIHWFNPLVWLAFTLMAIDMELSCDEKALKEGDRAIKKHYANSLLSLASGRHIFNGSPLAFGEGNTKRRIENVLNYRKPSFWVIIVALIGTMALGFSLLGNPISADKGDRNHIESYKKTGDTGKLVEGLLDTILSSPKESSNPQDYINAHQYEYEDILKYGGEDALNYMLGQFKSGNSEGLRGHIMMSLSKELLGARNNVTDDTLSPQNWYQALKIRQEVIIPDFKYDGRDPVEKLVYETELEGNSSLGRRGGFLVVAPIIYGTYQEEDMLKVFVVTYSQVYKLYENTLSDLSGSVIPVAITYKRDGNGDYILDQYEQAKDGSDFAPSIRKFCTMPGSNKEIKGLAEKILNDYGTSPDIRQLMYTNLYNHLKENGVTDAILRDPYGEVVFSMTDFS